MKKVFLVLAALAVLYIAFTAAAIVDYGNKRVLIPADAAVILGAGVDGNSPSPVFNTNPKLKP